MVLYKRAKEEVFYWRFVMSLYEEMLENEEYLDIMKRIDNMHFIKNNKWDWEHGIGHAKRVAIACETILRQLGVDDRIVELSKLSGLIHDVGLLYGKKNHPFMSYLLSSDLLFSFSLTKEECELVRHAILYHSDGQEICHYLDLALLLADKLDVNYKRVEHATIHDTTNQEIGKIKKVDVLLDDHWFLLNYHVEEGFRPEVLMEWSKSLSVPLRCAKLLEKEFLFSINGKEEMRILKELKLKV